MNKKLKVALVVILLVIVAGFTAGVIMWNRPERKVEDEKGIEITAVELVKEYQANEPEANKKYLDKALQVTGTVGEVKTNQEGKPTIQLSSEDAFAGVFCTLKEKSANVLPGTVVTIKGLCSGMLSDVRLREAVVVK